MMVDYIIYGDNDDDEREMEKCESYEVYVFLILILISGTGKSKGMRKVCDLFENRRANSFKLKVISSGVSNMNFLFFAFPFSTMEEFLKV
jgi:hypothetical protein